MVTSAEALKPGDTISVVWEANRKLGKPDAVKSNKTDRGKTKKIVLPVANVGVVQPKPGEEWVCRVEQVHGKAVNRGSILVRPLTRKLEYKFEGVYIPPLKAQLIATVVQDRTKNLMLEGEQGVGKSTIAEAIAHTLDWEYRKVSGGLIKKFVYMLGRYVPYAGDQPIAFDSVKPELLELFKKYMPAAQGADKALSFSSVDDQLRALLIKNLLGGSGGSLTFKWMDSKLVEVLREALRKPHKQFLLMIDEYTRIDEDARDALLDVIYGKNRVLRLPTGEEIVIAPNIVFMAAGNVGDGFTIKREDAAAKDRWVIIKITVMPQEEELEHCLRLYPSAPRDELNRALGIINKVRDARKDRKMRLSKIVSTRGAETVAMLLAQRFALDIALETAVTNQYAGSVEDGQTSEAGRVAALIKNELEKKE
jgi:MoxR-like ATPase